MSAHEWKSGWVDAPEIEEILDVSTAACTYCGKAARVPEDVVAVFAQEGREPLPLIVCPDCTPEFSRWLGMRMDELPPHTPDL